MKLPLFLQRTIAKIPAKRHPENGFGARIDATRKAALTLLYNGKNLAIIFRNPRPFSSFLFTPKRKLIASLPAIHYIAESSLRTRAVD